MQVKQGQTLREALVKPLKLRELEPNMCSVYKGPDQDIPLPWDTDISSLEGGEVYVRIKESFPLTMSIRHTFVSILVS